ncbi:MAG: hypothetical protein UT00_C0021G0006 [Parcubacteria group bacterium GW2011_GWA1_38_7]|nr:MAG: hypothetical protein UT00_C0021G0006 [Parcubacteria group bacterium GW2011_GWA1_38_7]
MQIAHYLAHFFVPHHSNNHRAKLLHPLVLTFIALFLVLGQLGLGLFGKATQGKVLGYAANISPSEVVRLTNIKRAEAGVEPLRVNPALSIGAKAKGEYMLEHDFWAHVAPDGTQPWKFFGDVGYKYRYAGENLARDFSNPQSAVEAWMASPTHKENLLSPKYSEIGIGVVEGDLSGVDTTLVVQFFGTQMTDTIPVTPVAAAEEKPVEQENVLTLSQAQIGQKVLISPFNTTKGLSLVIVGILLGVLVLDVIVISRRRITRVSSRSVAHIAFLVMLILIIVIVRAGQII